MADKGKINESQIKCQEWNELALPEMALTPFFYAKRHRNL